jgi:nicotinate dehydrogenase subunit B
MNVMIDRVTFLKQSGGLLLVSFAMGVAPNPRSIESGSNEVGAWLAIDRAGRVTLYSGKVELGTGTQTALIQLVADELRVPFDAVRMIAGITGVTPDQGDTAGSQTIMSGSIPMRRAAATARTYLLELAAKRGQDLPGDGDRSRAAAYGALLAGHTFNLAIDPQAPLLTAAQYRLVGRPIKRVDIPEKAYGTFEYVQNVRIPGMWHARAIRPDRVGARFVSLDRSSVAKIPNLHIVQKGNFVAVAAPSEWDAIRAARDLKVTWSGGGLPAQRELYDIIRKTPAEVRIVQQVGDADGVWTSGAVKRSATYLWPFQTHGSIGPSCGVAQVHPSGTIEVWNGTQGVYPMRDAIADLVGIPKESIVVHYAEASGCYGHNGADDSATDAVLVARTIGKPVRVQWSRADEHGWDPKGPAMIIDLRGAVGHDGTVTAWTLDTYTPTHSTRPEGQAGNLLDGQLMNAPPGKNAYVGGDRNASNMYAFANKRVSAHWLPKAALRSSAMRGLGAPANCFASECFIDELAHASNADPVAFRLAHLHDPRAKDVINAVVQLANWTPDHASGRGVAFARYESTSAYVAMIADVDVDRSTGAIRVRDIYIAHDCGLVVNPDGVRNQIEGAVIQGTSRALLEEVTFDRNGVTSIDWETYPILRFSQIPNVHISLIDRPNERPLGAGEPATVIVAAAIGNAVFSATGVRLREVPFTAARVKSMLNRA